MNLEEFNKNYKSFIMDWIDIKNNEYNNVFYIEKNDFYSEVYTHLFLKPDKSGIINIDKFNDKYSSLDDKGNEFETTFKAWLSKVLWNIHIDLYRKTRTTQTITEIVDGEEKKTKLSVKRFSNIEDIEDSLHPIEDGKKITDSDNKKFIKNIINNINDKLNVKERVLIKLKVYIENKIKFDKEELNFMADNSNMKKNEVLAYISENKKEYKIGGDHKNFFGIKNKNIPLLTGLAEGSISSLFNRIVRKLNIQTYK